MKRIFLSVISIAMVLALVGCSTPAPAVSTTETPTNSTQTEIPEATTPPTDSGTRTIVDLGGNTVTLPPAEEIKNIVIISPPTTSILLGVIPDTNMIVGVNDRAFKTANMDIISSLFPNCKDVETSFISEKFVTNTEELLNLKPDIVFYYGKTQKKGIENLEIPIVDFMIVGENDPEIVTVKWDKLMREIFDVEGTTTIEQEWKTSNQKVQDVLSSYDGEPKSALFLFSNIGGIISVYGNGSYADAWFEKSGLTNVAKDVKGCAEVSMEQLYDWNPDYIFVFIGSPASAMQNNKIDGQDWSLLSAYENKRIIDIPQSIFSWGAPCSDSPLMPLWLTSQCYSELLSKNTFKTLYSDYYNRMYNIELKDELMESILSPRKPKK